MNEQPVRSLMSCLCYCIFQAAVFMGFSITSALLGGLIILIYSFWIDVITSYRSNNSSHYDAKFAVAIITLILGICSLVAGISAAISVCLMNPCNCCAQTWVNTHKKITVYLAFLRSWRFFLCEFRSWFVHSSIVPSPIIFSFDLGE